MKPFLLFFGCWGQAGHYLWDRNHTTIYRPREFGFPFDSGTLDGNAIFLPHPEQPGIGALTHVVRGEDAYTVLAWWGSPFDRRGAVNSAIVASGWESADLLWSRFSRVYESLAVQLTMPELVEGQAHG